MNPTMALATRLALLAVLYWAGVQAGLLFFEEQISILWPANGIALAFFIASRTRIWPLLAVAMTAGYFLGLIHLSAQPLSIKAGFLVANFVEILPAAYLIRRVFARGIELASLKGLCGFIGFGVVMGPLLGSLVATYVAHVGFGQEFSLMLWMGWGIGNAVSTLVVAVPTYLLLFGDWAETPAAWRRAKPRAVVELAALVTITAAASWFVFSSHPAVLAVGGSIYILFFLAIWAAVRFPLEITSTWLLAVVLCAAACTAAAEGPFVAGTQEFRTAVFHLHMFSFTLCMTGLFLGGLMADQRRTETSLRESNEAKTSFLSSMSHELRTPLNAIIGFSDVIKYRTAEAAKSEPMYEYADDINQAGLHLLSLVNDILDLSKVEAGEEVLQEIEVDFAILAKSVVTMVNAQAETAGVALVIELDDDLERLRADPRKMKQMLLNLLSNAIKFTDRDGLVTLRAWSSAESGFVVEVSDTGIGIANDDIPRVLSQFGRVETGLTRRYEGTGLGLPLTKAHVELHGGSLDLQSVVGTGTTIKLRFPAARLAGRVDRTGLPDTDIFATVRKVA